MPGKSICVPKEVINTKLGIKQMATTEWIFCLILLCTKYINSQADRRKEHLSYPNSPVSTYNPMGLELLLGRNGQMKLFSVSQGLLTALWDQNVKLY